MDTLTRLPWAAKSAVFQKLEEIADVASLSRHERMKYDEGLRKYRDTLSVLEGVRNDGEEEGRAKGLAEGLAKGHSEGIEHEKIETARRMGSMGFDTRIIAGATGLPESTIKDLLG